MGLLHGQCVQGSTGGAPAPVFAFRYKDDQQPVVPQANWTENVGDVTITADITIDVGRDVLSTKPLKIATTAVLHIPTTSSIEVQG